MHFGWLPDETPHGAPHTPCSDLNHKQSLLQLTLKICSSQWVFWQLSPSLIWHSIVLLCFGGKLASRANKVSWNLRPMESRRYQTFLFLKGTLSPSVFIGMSHFEESVKRYEWWFLEILMGSSCSCQALRKWFRGRQVLLWKIISSSGRKPGQWWVGGGWLERRVVPTVISSRTFGAVIFYISFILVFYPLTTLSSLPSEWCFLLQYLFLNNPIEGTQGWHPISLN